MDQWGLFFSWPSGGVWSNLIANLVWVPIAGLYTWAVARMIKRHHKERIHQAQQLHAQLKKHITEQIEALK